jgi:hypothetical protein
MAASTFLGFVPKDHPIFSGALEVFSRLRSRPSSTSTAPTAAWVPPAVLPLPINDQAGSLDPTDGMDRQINEHLGPPCSTDLSATSMERPSSVRKLHMMQHQEHSSMTQSTALTDSWYEQLQALDAWLLASGRTARWRSHLMGGTDNFNYAEQEDSTALANKQPIRVAGPNRGDWQIEHQLRKNELALVHGGFGRKSAKNPKSDFRRSNRDQTQAPNSASKSLTYDTPM